MQTQEAFEYSSQPHAAPTKRKAKYRNENEEENNDSQNIMYDSRVARGNTYAAKTLTPNLKKELDLAHKKTNFRKGIKLGNGIRRVSTPPPVDGRSHMNMQTDDYLEEITDRPIEQDVETQTNSALDRPASPLFVRAKIGIDIETQIENGDLFDFDLEVEPILEVLVGKTIHVAMLELMQETELEAIRIQQEEYEIIRNIELAEVQRLESEIKRKQIEKERRIAQEKKRLLDRQRLDETIAARAFSNQFLGELHINVFDMLEEQGAFYDPVKKEVEDIFMVQLLQGLRIGTDSYEVASQMALELLEEARKKAKAFEIQAIQLRKELYAQQAAEEAERIRIEEEQKRLAIEAAKALEETEENNE